jgi:hypothetical protein
VTRTRSRQTFPTIPSVYRAGAIVTGMQAHQSFAPISMTRTSQLCRHGIVADMSDRYAMCCNASCPVCGGSGCARRPGPGRFQCCRSAIRMKTLVECRTSKDVGCVFEPNTKPHLHESALAASSNDSHFTKTVVMKESGRVTTAHGILEGSYRPYLRDLTNRLRGVTRRPSSGLDYDTDSGGSAFLAEARPAHMQPYDEDGANPKSVPMLDFDRFCADGIKNFSFGSPVCCASSCGTCPAHAKDVRGCSRRPGKRAKCCVSWIRQKDAGRCNSSRDVGCVLSPEATLLALRKELRAAILKRAKKGATRRSGPLQSFNSCAVVGSSGALRLDRFGPEIDEHDVIIRFNSAPVTGYEPIVGSRTTLRLMNSQALGARLSRCHAAWNNCEPHHGCCPKELIIMNSGYPAISSCFQRACRGQGLSARHRLITHPMFLAAPSKKGTSMLSGIFGLALATALCDGRVDAYGFTSNASQASLAAAGYHYYDKCKPAENDPVTHTAMHFEAGWLQRMNQQLGTNMRLREGSARGALHLFTSHRPLMDCPSASDAIVTSIVVQKAKETNTSSQLRVLQMLSNAEKQLQVDWKVARDTIAKAIRGFASMMQ